MTSDKKLLERQCAVSKEVRLVSDMVRFVEGPSGEVVPDLKGNLPGRGMWISIDRSLMERAVKKEVFTHGLKSNVSVNPNLPDQIGELLQRHALGSLGMVRKAGMVVTGFVKTTSAIRTGGAIGVLHAGDTSLEGLKKLKGAILSKHGNVDAIPIIRVFTSIQLSEILGRANVVNAALLGGAVSRIFVERANKLVRYQAN